MLYSAAFFTYFLSQRHSDEGLIALAWILIGFSAVSMVIGIASVIYHKRKKSKEGKSS